MQLGLGREGLDGRHWEACWEALEGFERPGCPEAVLEKASALRLAVPFFPGLGRFSSCPALRPPGPEIR